MTKISSEFTARVQVVGTVHSPGALQSALRLKPGSLDLLELRLDAFAADTRPLERALPRLKFPLLITARHPAEGGAGRLSTARRRELLWQFLHHASWMDLELRSLAHLGDVAHEALRIGVRIVGSSHFFHSMPPPARVKSLLSLARRARVDVFKLAARTARPADVAALLKLFPARSEPRLAVMGMGPFGRVSRLALAQAGSVLNYGYLDHPNASGQWEAVTLRKRIDEIYCGS